MIYLLIEGGYMKKKGLLLVGLAVVLLSTGCGKEETKTMTCTRTGTITEGVNIDLNYKVTYTGKYVDLVETEEKLTSEDQDYLKTYKETVEKMYAPYKDVEHYDADITLEKGVLSSKTKIDYSKIDTNKMIEIDSANGALIKDGKIAVEDLKATYESLGTTCK